MAIKFRTLISAVAVFLGLLDVWTVQATEILVHPQTRYVMTGDTVIFHCKTIGTYTYWLINNEALSSAHSDIQDRYETQGFVFNTSRDIHEGFYNLTMSVLASNITNKTFIECRAIDSNLINVKSNRAYLWVLNSLRPNAPFLSVYVSYNPTVPPLISAMIVQGQPLWPGYVISGFNLTIISNGQLLSQINVPVSNDDSSYYFNQTFPDSIAHHCSSISVFAFALSSDYGKSLPSTIKRRILAAPGNFSTHAINDTIYFYPNGTPFLSLQIELPIKLCVEQQINYTIVIEDINHRVPFLVGPFTYAQQESKIVSKDTVSLLKRDHNYTVKVQHIISIAGTSESKERFVSTVLNLSSETCATKGNYVLMSYTIVIGVSLAAAVLSMSVLVVGVMCQYVCTRKNLKVHRSYEMSVGRVRQSMVNNPVYEGPLYESVEVKFATLLAEDAQQLEATSDTKIPTQKIAHYVDYFSEPVPIKLQRMKEESMPVAPLSTRVRESQIKLE